MNKTKYELICVLVNQGFTEVLMEAARKAGVRGGTIITSRGAANEKAEKNYGVAITPDKEFVMMLVDSEIKEAVIKAVYNVVGIETKGMGIIWSMPADNVVGMSKKAKVEVKTNKK